MDLQILWFCPDRGSSGAATSCSRASTSASACCCRSCPRDERERGAMFADDRPGLGRQRGLARRRRRRDVRGLPGLVRDDVLRLLPRAAARPLLPDRPRRLVRVAREERRARAGARSGLWANAGRQLRRIASSGASASRTSSTASRSTRAATSPATSGTSSAATPCSAGSRSCSCSPSTARPS